MKIDIDYRPSLPQKVKVIKKGIDNETEKA